MKRFSCARPNEWLPGRQRSVLFVAGAYLICAGGLSQKLRAADPAVPSWNRIGIRAAIEKSIPYLETDGRAWFEGEFDIQEQGCVSCHQVPSAVWSLTHSYASVDTADRSQGKRLLEDAVEFIADPEVGRPAMWAQVLITAKAADQTYSFDRSLLEHAKSVYLPKILETQQDDGRWQAKGQFPSQRRPIKESDAVITAWMIVALSSDRSPEVVQSLQKARKYVAKNDGSSTEFLAWQMIIEGEQNRRAKQLSALLEQQLDDGSFGWSDGQPGNVDSTSVVLFALSQFDGNSLTESLHVQCDSARKNAVAFLLASQQADGIWVERAELITKDPGDSHQYIYQYWSTAWATLALSQTYRTTGY